jgi:hypothetical protein
MDTTRIGLISLYCYIVLITILVIYTQLSKQNLDEKLNSQSKQQQQQQQEAIINRTRNELETSVITEIQRTRPYIHQIQSLDEQRQNGMGILQMISTPEKKLLVFVPESHEETIQFASSCENHLVVLMKESQNMGIEYIFDLLEVVDLFHLSCVIFHTTEMLHSEHDPWDLRQAKLKHIIQNIDHEKNVTVHSCHMGEKNYFMMHVPYSTQVYKTLLQELISLLM